MVLECPSNTCIDLRIETPAEGIGLIYESKPHIFSHIILLRNPINRYLDSFNEAVLLGRLFGTCKSRVNAD